jgi:hypothetical protein
MNEYFNEMSKYLESGETVKDMNREDLFEKFVKYQNYMQSQTNIISNPVQVQNKTLSTSNNSEGSKNKEEKEPEHEDRPTAPKSFDDIPIQPKSTNFYELLESNLASATEDIPQQSNKRFIKYEPRRRRTDMLHISEPTEQKKYKYYSQNFNKNFGTEEQVPEVIDKKPEKQKA